MKTINLLLICCFSFVALTAMTCEKDDSDDNSPTALQNIALNGKWKITYYYDTDHEETNSYINYRFTFAGSNLVTATNGTTTITGTWSVTDSNSNDDSLSDLDFNLLFTSPAQFSELSDDWEVIEKSATVIKLKDVSGGNGGTDYLTFTKN